ncbi:MAG: DUF5684 domain-containing protein [Bacteroidota bacterium]
MIWMLNMISLSFGKGAGFTVGLLLLPIIFVPVLGLGPAKYVGPGGKKHQDAGNQPSAPENEQQAGE